MLIKQGTNITTMSYTNQPTHQEFPFRKQRDHMLSQTVAAKEQWTKVDP